MLHQISAYLAHLHLTDVDDATVSLDIEADWERFCWDYPCWLPSEGLISELSKQVRLSHIVLVVLA